LLTIENGNFRPWSDETGILKVFERRSLFERYHQVGSDD